MSGIYRYAYPAASTVTAEEGLRLATCGGVGSPGAGRLSSAQATSPLVGPGRAPVFFTGFASRPAVVAAGLLAVAEVARARYHQRVDVVARDPVITSDGSMLRVESFSDCCGVYSRLDLLPEGLDGTMAERGTTNVDVNEPLRRALARTTDDGLLHLSVGIDALTVTTGDGGVVERKVPLPERWLRGFAEVRVRRHHGPALRAGAAVPQRRRRATQPAAGGCPGCP